jgi:conjugative transposon TraM protein
MKTTAHVIVAMRKKKMLLIMPLMVIPFLTLFFWAMGGGRGTTADGGMPQAAEGLNTKLPDAKLKDDRGWNKLSYYEKAADEAGKRKDQALSESYLNANIVGEKLPDTASLKLSPYTGQRKVEYSEAIVNRRLADLNKVLQTPAPVNERYAEPMKQRGSENNPDVKQLESMMRKLQEPVQETDPELEQLNGMLEKLIDVQHPERVKEKMKPVVVDNKVQVLPVAAVDEECEVSLLSAAVDSLSATFYSSATVDSSAEFTTNIPAVIAETVTLSSGATVKLELSADAAINGILLPAGTFVYGTVSLEADRLKVLVKSIRSGNTLFPVSLNVYDFDGIEGIYVPGTDMRDVAKQSADNSLRTMGVGALDPSVGAQAAMAGIETAKNMLSKKVKKVQVTITAGYRVLLADTRQVNY